MASAREWWVQGPHNNAQRLSWKSNWPKLPTLHTHINFTQSNMLPASDFSATSYIYTCRHTHTCLCVCTVNDDEGNRISPNIFFYPELLGLIIKCTSVKTDITSFRLANRELSGSAPLQRIVLGRGFLESIFKMENEAKINVMNCVPSFTKLL